MKRFEIEEEDTQKKQRQHSQGRCQQQKKLAELTSEPDNESSDDDDDTSWKQCGRYWFTYKGKKSVNWLICDLCDQYICPKCVLKDVDLNKDFFCNAGSAGD